MKIIELKDRNESASDIKFSKLYAQFAELLNELSKKDLPPTFVKFVNDHVEELNASSSTGTELKKLIKNKQSVILKQAEKQLKLVTKNYYRSLYMPFGLSGIGLPIGVAIGLSVGNIGLLGLGLPIGMIVGMAIGLQLDRKALRAGRQLNLEIN